MEQKVMNLKILLPFRVFAEIPNVSKIIAETNEGFYGFLPQRLDCVTALVPGILNYETDTNEIHYVAIDEGIFVKAGLNVLVSVSNAFEGTDLSKLRETIDKEYLETAKSDTEIRSSMAKMESILVKNLEHFHK